MEAVAALERDAELMLRVRDGDATSFALLLERHRVPVVHFLYRMVQNQAVSEELAQEVFLRVFRSLRSFRTGEGSFTVWLGRLTRNLLIDHYRRSKAERVTDSIEEQLPMLKEQTRSGGFRPRSLA